MLRFGIGLFIIYFIFLMLFRHALSKKEELNLNALEIFKTKTSIQEYFMLTCITTLSIVTIIFLPDKSFIFSSLVYLLIPIVLTIHGMYRKKIREI
jgi:hypothetical protein